MKWFVCDLCDGKYSSKRTLNNHIPKCKPWKGYECPVCKENIKTFKELYDHKRKVHSSDECKFCGKSFSYYRNLKRHMSVKHKGLRPSTAGKVLKINQLSKKVYLCKDCDSFFQNKSNLNRHMKQHGKQNNKTVHIIECQKRQKDQNIVNGDLERKKVPNVIGQYNIKKKTLSWSTDLEKVKEIPRTKLVFNSAISSKLKLMFDNLEQIMVFCKIRCQALDLELLIDSYERKKKTEL